MNSMILVVSLAVYFTCFPVPALGKTLQKDKIEKRDQSHVQQKSKKKVASKLQVSKSKIRIQKKIHSANKSNVQSIKEGSVTDDSKQEVRTYGYKLGPLNGHNTENPVPVGDFGTEKIRSETAR